MCMVRREHYWRETSCESFEAYRVRCEVLEESLVGDRRGKRHRRMCMLATSCWYDKIEWFVDGCR